jgi:hypothetical protein
MLFPANGTIRSGQKKIVQLNHNGSYQITLDEIIRK